MYKYVTGKNGVKYAIDFFATIDKSKANNKRDTVCAAIRFYAEHMKEEE